jgi:hypothetical protein
MFYVFLLFVILLYALVKWAFKYILPAVILGYSIYCFLILNEILTGAITLTASGIFFHLVRTSKKTLVSNFSNQEGGGNGGA